MRPKRRTVKTKIKPNPAKAVQKPIKTAAKKKQAPGKRTLNPRKKIAAGRTIPLDQFEMPARYPASWIGLMAKDPFWIFVSWEIAYSDIRRARAALHDVNRQAKTVLRLYDVTLIDFNGNNAHHWFDLAVEGSSSRYVNLWSDQVSYCAEIGLRTSRGKFFSIARSNVVQTPRAGFSSRSEQIWMEVNPSAPLKVNIPSAMYIESYLPDETGGKGGYPRGQRIDIGPDDVRRYYDALMPRLRDLLRGRLKRGYRLRGDGPDDQGLLYKLLPSDKFIKRILAGSSNELVELMDLENVPSRTASLAVSKANPLIPIQDLGFE